MATRTVRRRVIVGLFRFVLLVVAVPVTWFIAALVLGSIPANVAWHEPDRGITLYIRTNGVHTWIVMPKVNAIMDWRPYAPPEHLRDPRYGRGDYVAIGYGNRDFYLNTPTWADVELGRALKALLWDETVLRVDYRWRPQPGEACAEWRVSVAEYGRIAAFVGESLRGSQGQTVRVAAGYGAQDAFFAAAGFYSPVDTCNQWTGRALRAGGAPVAAWTPFSFLVLWNLPTISM